MKAPPSRPIGSATAAAISRIPTALSSNRTAFYSSSPGNSVHQRAGAGADTALDPQEPDSPALVDPLDANSTQSWASLRACAGAVVVLASLPMVAAVSREQRYGWLPTGG